MLKKQNKINTKMIKMREFENGREGKKIEGKNGMDLSNMKSIRNLKLYFTNYFPNLMSLTFQWF